MTDHLSSLHTAPHVLVVDDDPDILTSLQDLLEHEGYQVGSAQTCSDAIVAIERKRFNVVLLDLGLPDQDGLAVLAHVQQTAPLLPVIVLTAYSQLDCKLNALTEGAFAFLTKPYHGDELRAMVSRAIGVTRLADHAHTTADALTESELRFQAVVDAAPDTIVVADDQGYIVSWNASATCMFQYQREEAIGRPLSILMPMRYREAHEMGIERIRMSGRSSIIGKTLELHGLRKDGQEFPIELSLAGWKANGRTYYSGIIRDITVRKESERRLRQSLDRFQFLIDHASVVLWETDPAKNHILYISPSFERIWGRSISDLYHGPRLWLEAVHPEDRPRVLHAAMTKQAVGTYHEEYRIVRPDGTIRWIRDRAYPIHDSSGFVSRITGMAEDITDQQELLAAQRLSEQRTRLALATAELGIWEWDETSGRFFCSARVMSFLGQPDQARTLSQDEILSLIDPADQLSLRAIWAEAFSTAPTVSFTHHVRRQDGSRRRLSWFGYAQPGEQGRTNRIVGSAGLLQDYC
jgi:PAS domain S-box-containing protein